jgi:NTP pyrophosphatase (non-canonical NTP hydrolase)
MEYNIDESIIAKSIKHYGAEIQGTVYMEECAELIQAISKAKRGKFDENNMTEEIADVLICIEILKQIYNIPDYSIKNWIERKQKRILDRMEK